MSDYCSVALGFLSKATQLVRKIVFFASILNNTDRRYFDSDSHTLAKQPLGPQAVYTSLVIFPPFWLGAAPYEGVELSAKTKSSRKGFALSLNKTLLGPVEHFVVLEAMRIEHPAEEPS